MSQTVSQLQQVTEFLYQSLKPYVKANNIDAWQERGTLILSGEDLGNNGYQVAKWKHNAVIAIEQFPHTKFNAYNLLAMLPAFLLDSGWERDEYGLADPQLDIDVVSRDHAMVLIELELIDDIDLIPDDNGPVLFNGKRYRVALVPVDVAETADVQTRPEGAQ
ncbi:phage tail protein [Shewanella xiamenensis]|uniref:Phage tail protein n=1 Tax=Shewanella xiamenensis TaxID=332186 RepID=A0ABT6U6Y2_9GAMM|nr:phage tail protein [Shewanella xiamenensis]MDI5830197.1 phage tail protein [Shewanella xiamenensis]